MIWNTQLHLNDVELLYPFNY